MKSNMIRKSSPSAHEHISPLAQAKNHEGYDGIKVRMLFWPDEKAFKRMVYKATLATRGSDVDSNYFSEKVVQEAFSGGLNQCLEWATVVFEISGISRGVTHELVRTRKASFAQQSFRHTDMGNANVRMPEEIANNPDAKALWERVVNVSVAGYVALTEMDIPFQDARTVLPIGTETYIIACYPLSEFINTFSYRACTMMYPEIVVLFKLMKVALLEVCPWLEPYIKISCEKTKANEKYEHTCTWQGWESPEGMCPFSWAKNENRHWVSTQFKE